MKRILLLILSLRALFAKQSRKNLTRNILWIASQTTLAMTRLNAFAMMRLNTLAMTAVKSNFNRIRRLLVLAFCILCPICAFADPSIGGSTPDPDPKKKESPQDQSVSKQQPSTPNKEDETLMKDLFKDATYENFAPQEKAEKQKLFDEDYLEPRK